MGSIEEHQVSWDASVWSEDPVGEADDGVEIKVFEQFLLDSGADAVAEERAVWDDDRSAARFRRTFKFAHDELQEEQRGFGGLFVLREVTKDATFFLAAEGRVGHDDINPVFVADFAQRKP